MKQNFLICLFLGLLVSQHSVAQTVVPDSVLLPYLQDEAEKMHRDSLRQHHLNHARGLNASRYVLEDRYRNYGDRFSHRFLDHLFLQGGVGIERILPPDDDYSYDVLGGAHIAIGKQWSKLSTLRLSLVGHYGYQRQYDYSFYKIGGRLDYLYSISNYFGGYNPARRMEVQAIFGLGLQYGRASHFQRSSVSPEFHLGAQFKFFTGPQGYLAVEPYLGVGSDQMDVSSNNNWRGYDIFYGANLSVVYYLRNNLSPEARWRFMRQRSQANYLTADSVAQSWRMPFFLEVSNGIHLANLSDLGLMKSMGSDWRIAVGKWISPALGLRLSAFSRSALWRKEEVAATSSWPALSRDQHSLYSGGAVDLLLNPMGLSKNYLWNRPFSFFVPLGVEYGQLQKFQTGGKLSCRALGLTAGVHLGYTLSEDLQAFIEPKYEWLQYRIPYSNVDWYKRFSENGWSIAVGVSVMMRGKRYRQEENADFFGRHLQPLTVGLWGGMNFVQAESPYLEGTSLMNMNYGGYVECHFSHVHGIRAAFERLSHHADAVTTYLDVTYDAASGVEAAVVRQGLWKHNWTLNLLSLGYQMDLTAALSGVQARRPFTLSAFIGPAAAFGIKDSGHLDSSISLQEGHEARPVDVIDGVKAGGVLGFKLQARVSPHIAVTLSPSWYLLHDLTLSGLDLPRIGGCSLVETLNVGVQYSLSFHH